MLFEDTNGHGRLGLGPVSNAYLHKNPPTVLEAWVASGAISNTNVSLRLCPSDNAASSFFDFGTQGFASRCNAASPQIAWMESPGPGAYLVEVYDVRIGGQPAPIDNAFQFNSTYSVIQSCNDKVLLTPDIADMFKNKIVASAGYPSDVDDSTNYDFFNGHTILSLSNFTLSAFPTSPLNFTQADRPSALFRSRSVHSG
nr:hypothetical protein HK105_008093 [Polyrhizophydium stewartii]